MLQNRNNNNGDDSSQTENNADDTATIVPTQQSTQSTQRDNTHIVSRSFPTSGNSFIHTNDAPVVARGADSHTNSVRYEESHNASHIVSDLIVDEVEPPSRQSLNNQMIEIKFCDKSHTIDSSNKRSRCVVNLSSRPLTETETNVLSKGLKFCPTPGEPDMYNIHQDLREYFRRLRLRAYFFDDNPSPTPTQNTIMNYFSQNSEKSEEINLKKFKAKSTWEPPDQYRDPVVETFCKSVQEEVSKFKPREPRIKNITLDEKNAIKALQNDQNIVIKKADKGSAIVVMDRCDYITEAERQLNDIDFYQKTPTDLTTKHVGEIREFLLTMKDEGEID